MTRAAYTVEAVQTSPWLGSSLGRAQVLALSSLPMGKHTLNHLKRSGKIALRGGAGDLLRASSRLRTQAECALMADVLAALDGVGEEAAP